MHLHLKRVICEIGLLSAGMQLIYWSWGDGHTSVCPDVSPVANVGTPGRVLVQGVGRGGLKYLCRSIMECQPLCGPLSHGQLAVLFSEVDMLLELVRVPGRALLFSVPDNF